jgi:hypothetical protein
MTSLTILAFAGALAFGLGVWTWVLRPLWTGEVDASGVDPRVLALLAEREAALAELRDLDADHRDGRLSGEDHQELRAEVLARGASILAALDRLAEQEVGGAAQRARWVEAELARRLGDGPQGRAARESSP